MRDYLDMPFKIKAVSEDGLFSGYGSVFGVVDSYKEVVAPGAFAESLASRMPSLLWQHRSGEPIGVYSAVKEDSVGLHVEGKLALKTARGAEAYELLKMGAVSGLSIGFISREDSYDKVSGIRTLKKLDLWEVSLVTFPANDAARVSGVKSIDAITSLSDAEAYLRDAGGLSKREACALVARVKSLQGRSDSDELGELAALIKRNTSLLNH
ncbi:MULTISPECIES: HK97 family phage prohead protease [unclassified Acidovorax]|uniref:HK97 family phage prohead protease n=1 Tax=unclassified Acidovorax TaxID=2684926 RepID=UPI001C46CAEA|nr:MULTISPECIES: HK97 family phage prohead protease [unclassified Acidovorax]MBV7459839.1 HK97 family phage prohead protease [Acidovorax sp. sif0632]MBV7464864.1 HK97 family phage prohead protease [Acidovorax sp. sif0613]